MEFLSYEFMGDERELRSCPRIGTLEIVEPLKDAHYLAPCPLDDRWGVAPKATYPLYGKFDWYKAENGWEPKGIYLNRLICRIKAIDCEGKEFDPSFGPYGYELPEYVGEGRRTMGGLIRIHLDEPFRLDERGNLVGYDPVWVVGCAGNPYGRRK